MFFVQVYFDKQRISVLNLPKNYRIFQQWKKLTFLRGKEGEGTIRYNGICCQRWNTLLLYLYNPEIAIYKFEKVWNLLYCRVIIDEK